MTPVVGIGRNVPKYGILPPGVTLMPLYIIVPLQAHGVGLGQTGDRLLNRHSYTDNRRSRVGLGP